jgi:hypothetical protein
MLFDGDQTVIVVVFTCFDADDGWANCLIEVSAKRVGVFDLGFVMESG